MDKGTEKYLANLVDYQATFGTPEGKRVLWSMMRAYGFLSTSFVANDPYGSAFNEGQRSVVVNIFSKLKLDVRKVEAEINDGIKGEEYV